MDKKWIGWIGIRSQQMDWETHGNDDEHLHIQIQIEV